MSLFSCLYTSVSGVISFDNVSRIIAVPLFPQFVKFNFFFTLSHIAFAADLISFLGLLRLILFCISSSFNIIFKNYIILQID